MSATGYELLGFNSNPFNSNTAELEPEIAEYAVHPPYLDRTEQASYGNGVFFLKVPVGVENQQPDSQWPRLFSKVLARLL